MQWGIYIPTWGLRFVAAAAFGGLAVPWSRRIELAFHSVHRHELFHFAADYMTSQWELAVGQPCWRPRWALRDAKLGYIVDEEKLANAYMLRGFRYPTATLRARGAHKALETFVGSQPVGYRDALAIRDKVSFMDGCASLSLAYQGTMVRSYKAPSDGLDHVALFPALPRIDWRYCPIHIVPERRVPGRPTISVRYIMSIAGLEEAPGFIAALKRLDPEIADQWDETKRKLAKSTMLNGLDFKPWRKGGRDIYSVRVTGDVRAHLRNDRQRGVWIAEGIGRHKQMGHG